MAKKNLPILSDMDATFLRVDSGEKNGKPWKMAKILFSGSDKVKAAFVASEVVPFPPDGSRIAIQIPLRDSRDGDSFSPFWNEDVKIKLHSDNLKAAA